MMDELRVAPAFLKVAYTVADRTLVIGANEVQHIHEHAIILHGVENVRPYLAAGAGVAAVGFTIYYLDKKYSLLSRFLGRGSALFEVLAPIKSLAIVKDLVSNGSIEHGLREFFSDIEKHIMDIGGQELVDEIGDSKMEELKELQVKSVEMCSKEDVESTLGRQKAGVSKSQGPKAPSDLTVGRDPTSPNNNIVLFYKEPDEEVDRYHVTASNLSNGSITKFSSDDDYIILNLQTSGSYLISVQSEAGEKYSRKVTFPQVIPIGMWQETWDYEPSVAKDSGIETQSVGVDTVSNLGSASDIVHKDKPKFREVKSETVGTGTGDIVLWNSDIHHRLKQSLGEMTEEKWKEILRKLHDLGFSSPADLKFLKDENILTSLSATLNRVEILKLKEFHGSIHKWHEPRNPLSGIQTIRLDPTSVNISGPAIDVAAGSKR